MQVPAREIEDVDVVADCGAVFRGVVVAEDEEFLALSDGDLREEREEVVWYAEGVFAHDAAWMGAGGVEVAEESGVPFLGFVFFAGFLGGIALRGDLVGDDAFDGGFCAPVRVGWADRAVFWDGDHVLEACRVAVDGGGGGEDDVCYVVLFHC